MPEVLASFRGPVRCVRSGHLPGLTLCGHTAQAPGEPFMLAFSAAAPADFPDTLQDARVERLEEQRYRISSERREWLIEAPAVHLHRDITAAFYRAIPPRPVPWPKQVFWRIVLALAASRRGLALLRLLRR
jgi:hypothetical protein